MLRVTTVALPGLRLACNAPADGRAAWLVLDHQVFLEADPEQAHARFARMSPSVGAASKGP